MDKVNIDISDLPDQTLQQLTETLKRIALVDPTVAAVFTRLNQQYPIDSEGLAINQLRLALVTAIALYKDKAHFQQLLLEAIEQMPPQPILLKDETLES